MADKKTVGTSPKKILESKVLQMPSFSSVFKKYFPPEKTQSRAKNFY